MEVMDYVQVGQDYQSTPGAYGASGSKGSKGSNKSGQDNTPIPGTYEAKKAELDEWTSTFKQFVKDLEESRKKSNESAKEQKKAEKRKQIKMMMGLAGAMIARMYTKKSWQAFAQAMSKAASLSKGDASPADLDKAIQVLTQGLSKLELAEPKRNESDRGTTQDLLEARHKMLLGTLDDKINAQNSNSPDIFSESPVMLGSTPVAAPEMPVQVVDINL